jgi:hypothetical protein
LSCGDPDAPGPSPWGRLPQQQTILR